jgi:hypothetical protein
MYGIRKTWISQENGLEPLKHEDPLNKVYKFCSYPKENTTLRRYKDQPVNAV